MDVVSKNILFVDDDVDLCESFSAFLRRRGFNVTTSYSFSQAQKELSERNVDILFVDLLLDNKEGYPLITEAKTKNKNTYVVAFSGFREDMAGDKAREFGADKFISKPIDKKTIENLVIEISSQN